MKQYLAAFFILFLAAPFFSPQTQAQAQDIETGTWTGLMMPPGQEAVDVTFDVSMESDSLTISLIAGPAGILQLIDIEVKEDGLKFAFDAGTRILCDLKLKANDGYEGECAPEGQESGIIIMNPPKKGGE